MKNNNMLTRKGDRPYVIPIVREVKSKQIRLAPMLFAFIFVAALFEAKTVITFVQHFLVARFPL